MLARYDLNIVTHFDNKPIFINVVLPLTMCLQTACTFMNALQIFTIYFYILIPNLSI